MKPQPLQDRETRVISSSLELRAANDEGESRKVRGYAAKFNTFSQFLRDGGRRFRETILPGAFDGADISDVRALFNHDSNRVLARMKGGEGTLATGIDEVGLWYEFDAPNTTTGNDLLESVRRGDIDQSSFAFTVAPGGDTWERDEDGATFTRTISRIAALFDVSPVTEPAYADTSVAVRSLEQFAEEQEKPSPPIEETFAHSHAHRQRALDLIDKTANN